MLRNWASLSTCLLILICALPMAAQQPAAASANVTVPPMVNISGVLTDVNKKPLTGTIGVTFSIYTEEAGGAPLWVETQNVAADKNGHYSVMLGSTNSQGLPSHIFVTGEARWLGVQPQGGPEKPRTLLVSVPYALKALDAETLGGKPVSSFMMAPLSSGTKNAAIPPPGTITGSGTANHLPLFTGTTTIGNSKVYQSSSGDVGINTTSPAVTLDVKGKSDVRDTLTLFPKSTHPTLSVNGTAFQVSNNGTVTFVSGQTFPGTGTVTSVGSGAGLTGGPITGSGTLSIKTGGVTNAMLQHSSLTVNANSPLSGGGEVSLGGSTSLGLKSCSSNQILEFTGGAWACVNAPTGTVSDVAAGTDIIVNNPTGPTATVNVDTSKVPELAAANTFTAAQTVSITSGSPALNAENSGNGYGVLAGSDGGAGVYAVSGLDSNFAAGIVGVEGGFNNETVGVYGWTGSNTGIGLYGQNVSGSSVLFLSPGSRRLGRFFRRGRRVGHLRQLLRLPRNQQYRQLFDHVS
jgi:trimeric autotransporter adhesin